MGHDVIFGRQEKKHQKPIQFYQILEEMCPNGRKINLFATNNDIRQGWLSLGNELGPHYNWEQYEIYCDVCQKEIPCGQKRFKSKQQNQDICQSCLKDEDTTKYFPLENTLDVMVFHRQRVCRSCLISPIWGLCFTCEDCSLDLCEECYDKKKFTSEHISTHIWSVAEIPEDIPVKHFNSVTCNSCQMYPIQGQIFWCLDCAVNLCQLCFAKKREPQSHKRDHNIKIVLKSDKVHHWVSCNACLQSTIKGLRYKCTVCFNYDLCEKCYFNKASSNSTNSAHREFHPFIAIQGDLVSSDRRISAENPIAENNSDISDPNDVLARYRQLKEQKKNLQVLKSSIQAWGLFTFDAIKRNEMIIELKGELIRKIVAECRTERYKKMGVTTHLFKLDENLFLDATCKGNLARFINHSHEPNCYVEVLLVNNQKKFIASAKRGIKIAEELSFSW